MIPEMMLCVHTNQAMIPEVMLCDTQNQAMIPEMMLCARIKSCYDSRNDSKCTNKIRI